MKKLGLAALAALPLFAGCYAEAYPSGYYARSTVGVYPAAPSVYVDAPAPVYVGPPRSVYVAPRPVYVAPPRVYGRSYYGHGYYGHRR
jgi:hypothetical protein